MQEQYSDVTAEVQEAHSCGRPYFDVWTPEQSSDHTGAQNMIYHTCEGFGANCHAMLWKVRKSEHSNPHRHQRGRIFGL